MTFITTACLIFCLLPLAGIALSTSLKSADFAFNWTGIGMSALRFLLILPIVDAVLIRHAILRPDLGFIDEFKIRLGTDWSGHRVWFLLVLDFCFLMSYLLGSVVEPYKRLVDSILYFLQFSLTIYVLSSNLLIAAVAQVASALAIFFMIRFSLMSSAKAEAEYISSRVIMLYATLALLSMLWAVVEFSSRVSGVSASLVLVPSVAPNSLAIRLWLVTLLLSVPIAPWSNWFNRAMIALPEGIMVPVVTFLVAAIMRGAESYLIVYPGLGWKYRLVIYFAGLIGCLFSLGALFAAESKRAMLACMPKFFLSFILVAVGVTHGFGLEVIYLMCLFIPVFCGLILYASALKLSTIYQRVFVAVFLMLMIGVPGSPVYQIFSLVGSRSLEMGVGYALFFAIMWFLYFFANVFVCRRIFLDELPAAPGVDSALARSPMLLASCGTFLLLFISFVALANWGLV